MASLEHERLEQLFSAALERSSGSQRAEFLENECGDDTALRSRVTELLAAHEKAGSFLDTPQVDLDDTRDFCKLDEAAGTRIGRYKIIDKIGEGGFGFVFMAEQEEPVRRKVALKIIKLGMDTKEVIARFEAERQALALMDHVNIARVYDAGATENGRPYFVMELVKGVAINKYCDDHSLTTQERLELFLPVCHAVQHAHQKGIIHRDLKPNNVLVTLKEGKRMPKVIDFGIAKATSQRLTEKTLHTAFREFVGTPEYMSPDQAEISGMDIDTRSDIYSLGVLLYELLTSCRPFDKEMLNSSSLADILRVIREVEPPKPSSRWLTANSSADMAKLAELRRSEPRALARHIRGDLDWIVMRAMEKDRTRRYDTAKDLADDIVRHLAHEPIMASAPGLAYRCRKFVRRHRVGVLTASIVVLALITGFTLATVGLIQANSARAALKIESDAAKQAHADATAANRFLQQMLASVDPDKALGREVTVRYMLDEADDNIREGALSDQPLVEANVRTTLGETYEGLGLYETAEQHLRAASTIRQRMLGDQHPDTLRAHRALAGVVRIQGDFASAETLLRSTAETQRQVLGEDHPDTLASMTELALALWGPGRFTEAESIHRRTLEIQRQVLGEEHPHALESLIHLGGVNRALGKLDESESLLRSALKLCQRVHGEEHPQTTEALNSLGLLLEDQHHYEQAEELFRRTYEVDRHIFGPDHPRTLVPMNNVLRVLGVQGKVAEREPLIRERLAHLRRAAQRPNPSADELHAYAWELLNCESIALRDHRAALPVARRAVEIDGGKDANMFETLALAHRMNGNLDQAIAAQRQAIARASVGGPYNRADLEAQLTNYLMESGDVFGAAAVSWQNLASRLTRTLLSSETPGASLIVQADELMAERRFEVAAGVLRGCLAIRQKELPEGHWLIADTQSQIGAAVAAGGKHSEAEPILLEAYAQLQDGPEVPARQKRLAIERIVRMYEAWNKTEQASKWQKRLAEVPDEDRQANARDRRAAAIAKAHGIVAPVNSDQRKRSIDETTIQWLAGFARNRGRASDVMHESPRGTSIREELGKTMVEQLESNRERQC